MLEHRDSAYRLHEIDEHVSDQSQRLPPTGRCPACVSGLHFPGAEDIGVLHGCCKHDCKNITSIGKLPLTLGQRSEDCLTLNIWSKPTAKSYKADKPVFVLFHGGRKSLLSCTQALHLL